MELTPKEKEEIANLKYGFNRIKETEDFAILATRRTGISQKWSKKLLKISLYLNMMTLVIYLIGMVFVLTEAEPDFYASTPSGRIEGPLQKYYP